jgi:hypothetical protein
MIDAGLSERARSIRARGRTEMTALVEAGLWPTPAIVLAHDCLADPDLAEDDRQSVKEALATASAAVPVRRATARTLRGARTLRPRHFDARRADPQHFRDRPCLRGAPARSVGVVAVEHFRQRSVIDDEAQRTFERIEIVADVRAPSPRMRRTASAHGPRSHGHYRALVVRAGLSTF